MSRISTPPSQLPPPRTTGDQLDEIIETVQKQTAWMVKRAADEDARFADISETAKSAHLMLAYLTAIVVLVFVFGVGIEFYLRR